MGRETFFKKQEVKKIDKKRVGTVLNKLSLNIK